MKFAVVGEEERREAEPGLSGKCRVCGNVMIAKCGNVRVPHWAHRAIRTCDPWREPETPWHRDWKNQFPRECQEVIHESDAGEKHIADVKTEYGVVVEFQHSHLPQAEREAREKFYQKMVWVVDGMRLKRDRAQFFALVDQATVLNHEPLIVSIPWKEESALLRDWEASNVPVYFDFRDRPDLWRLHPGTPNVTPLWGPTRMTCLSRVPKDVFLNAKLKGQPFEKPASAEVERAAARYWKKQAQSQYFKDYVRYLARTATQIEEATIQKVCAPREGKKWGSVNSAEGSKFWGPPNVLRMFLEGEVCQIEYQLSGTKGDLKTIKKKLPPAFGKQSPSSTMTFNELETLIGGQIMNVKR